MKNPIGATFLFLALFSCRGGPPAEIPSSYADIPVDSQQAYYTGSGGSDLTITVGRPDGRNLPADEQVLLDLVQGTLTGDFQKYTAMTVTDRQNLDKILEEQRLSEIGAFSQENYAQIGRLTNAKYLLTGSITKAQNNYFLELAIDDAESGERKASYPPTSCTAEALQGLSVVKTASEDLFTQLGITLTDAGKQALHSVTAATVNAETALSRGIQAQRNGTIVEALSYYYEAASFDPSLVEAAVRASVVSANISSGNIGADARNDIQWRKDWIDRLTECENYFSGYIRDTRPSYDLVYTTALQTGEIDYTNETMPFSFEVYLYLRSEAWFSTIGKVVQAVKDGLQTTGRASVWGLAEWP
jgi:hypothetical protein